jgi:peptide/nickel transport system permease protein
VTRSRRLLGIVPTYLGITLTTFFLLHLVPGDPAQLRAFGSRSAESAAVELRRTYGLDRPLWAQYGAWLGRSARLDFGISLVDGRPVRDKLLERLPLTFAVALLALGLAYGAAIPFGVLFAGLARAGRGWAQIGQALELGAFAMYGLPHAALGLLLLVWGAPYGRGPGAVLTAATCLAVAHAARLSRIQSRALFSELGGDYVLTARMKGAGEGRVLSHALSNALLPLIALLATDLPALLSGSVIAEQVFGLPGLGVLGLDAVLERDYPVILGLTSLAAGITLVSVLASDLLQRKLDPRLRDDAREAA